MMIYVIPLLCVSRLNSHILTVVGNPRNYYTHKCCTVVKNAYLRWFLSYKTQKCKQAVINLSNIVKHSKEPVKRGTQSLVFNCIYKYNNLSNDEIDFVEYIISNAFL